jgi:pantetheine-phosphate adenylyltransferase
MIIYPGTFDPITNGHKNIIERSLNIFDSVLIAVAESDQKKTLFPLDVRLNFIKKIFENRKKITVISFSGLLKDLLIKKKYFMFLGVFAQLQIMNLNFN